MGARFGRYSLAEPCEAIDFPAGSAAPERSHAMSERGRGTPQAEVEDFRRQEVA